MVVMMTLLSNRLEAKAATPSLAFFARVGVAAGAGLERDVLAVQLAEPGPERVESSWHVGELPCGAQEYETCEVGLAVQAEGIASGHGGLPSG